MGGEIMTEVIESLAGYKMTPSEFAVLIALAYRASERNNREAWPGIETLAAEAHVSPSTAFRVTRALEAKGMITNIGTKRRYRCRIHPLESVTMTDSVGHHARLSRSPCTTESVTMTDELVKEQVMNQEENPVAKGSGCRTPSPGRGCQENPLNYKALAEHLNSKIMLEMHANGARATGRVNAFKVAGRLKTLATEFELDHADLHKLMHLYAISTSTWPPAAKHPVWWFTASHTITRLRNIASPFTVEVYEPYDDYNNKAERRARGEA